MYQAFYRLKDHPFRLTPDPAYICMTPQHREALSGLVYNVCTRPGLMVLTGEAGTGKTTLLHAVGDLLEKRNFVLARCNNPTLTREEFYDLLLAELGVECSSSLKSRQLRALHEALMRKRAAGWLAVLIVDEAQRLSCELLEEIRLLLNMETPREKLLQIIMAGQPELSQTLARPELRQLKQRVSAICRLEPLSLEELREYMQHRLNQAGLPDQHLFSEEVIGLILRYTQGIPRLVNSLCDSALQTGFALQTPRMTPAIIKEVADDLELSDSGVPKAQAAAAGAEHAPVGPVLVVAPPAPPVPKPLQNVANGNASIGNGSNGNGKGQNGKGEDGRGDARVPLESYSSRQKSLGFFGQLMDRWR
jgi:general secretion pathway protein A